MQRRAIYALTFALMACLMWSCNKNKKEEPQTYVDETEFAGVGGEKPSEGEEIVFEDSLDACNEEDQRTPPAAVDRNYDDFLYAFNVNRRFFVDRITLPLPVVKGGETTYINDYRKVRTIYRRAIQEVGYVSLTSNLESLQDIDRGALTETFVDAINLDDKSITSFHFEYSSKKWHMTSCEESHLINYPLNAFLDFYAKFATDQQFRQTHLASDIAITISTDDGPIEGNITPSQFDSFVTDLAQGTIVNIRLGQEMEPESPVMYMRKCSLAMGDERVLQFDRENGEWTLTAVR